MSNFKANILIPYLVNTNLFQEEAENFKRNGMYTQHPVGSYSYISYWTEQDQRCRDGYKVGDLWIPGTYYFYLNFTQLDVKDDKTGRRRKNFPRFTDIDLEYFLIMDQAREQKKGVILVKPRRTGFSFKNAGLLTHEYNFFRDSRCIIGGFDSKFSDNTMSMVLNNLNFLNANTPWGKERNPDTRDHVIARYREKNDSGLEVWKGYNSEIKSLTFKDNPFASIGLSSNLFLFEECFGKGTKILMNDMSFKNIEDIKVGDIVLVEGGKEMIVGLTTKGTDNLYEVKQQKGQNYIVNSKHRLYLEQHCNVKGYTDDGPKTYTPEEYNNLLKYKKRTTYGIKSYGLEFTERELPVDPYYLGLWLGDGDKNNTNIVVNHKLDPEIEIYLDQYAKSIGYKTYKYDIKNESNNCRNITILEKPNIKNTFLDKLKKLGVHKNKHIPKDYLLGSLEQRLQLLAGLIDSDGHLQKGTRSYSFSYEIMMTRKELIDQIKLLAQSCGYYVKHTEKRISNKAFKKQESIGYRLYLRGDLSRIPVKVERKKVPSNHKPTSNPLNTSISVEPIGKGEYYGITLIADNDNDRRLILEDFTLSMNCGKFPNIIQSYNISEPCWKDGDDMIGIPVLFGTGGDMEGGTMEFHEMYYDPDKYNLLAFENIWDENPPTKYSGWFIPAYKMRFGTYKDVSKVYPDEHGKPLVDKDGNSNTILAKQSILDLRKLKEQGSDTQAKRDTITQYPITPKEAFLTKASIYFPVRELQATLAKLNTPEELAKHNIGMLEFVDNEVKWQDVQGGLPIREYPIKTKEEGFIEIFEFPRKEITKIDKGRYIIGVDHYAKDEATTDSYGSAMVFDRLTRRIVAEYTGRPYNTDRFYEICRRLSIYYDAKIMYENNITNMFHYFEKKKSLSLLEDTPQNLRDRNTWMEGKNTSKGIVASLPTNQKGRELIKSWLLEPISEDSETLNLEKIRSVGLLNELIKWDPDNNYDRISAMIMTMLYDITLTIYQSEEIRLKKRNLKLGDFFKKFKQTNTVIDPLWEQPD